MNINASTGEHDPRDTSHLALAALVARVGLGMLLLKLGFMEVISARVGGMGPTVQVIGVFLDPNAELLNKIVALGSIVSGLALIFGLLTRHAAVLAAFCLTSGSWRGLISLFLPGAVLTPPRLGMPGMFGEEFYESRSTLGLLLAVVVLLLSPPSINRWTLESLVFTRTRKQVAAIRAGKLGGQGGLNARPVGDESTSEVAAESDELRLRSLSRKFRNPPSARSSE